MKRTVAILALVAGTLSSGCGGEDSPPDPCLVQGPVSFRSNVVPLLARDCAFSGCHGPRPEAELSLDGSPDDIHGNLLDASTTAPDLPRIAPGDPEGSFLIHKIRGDFDGVVCVDDDCGARMPKAADPLDGECQDMLAAWVTEGAASD